MSREMCYNLNILSTIIRAKNLITLAGMGGYSIVLKNYYQSTLLLRSRAIRSIEL